MSTQHTSDTATLAFFEARSIADVVASIKAGIGRVAFTGKGEERTYAPATAKRIALQRREYIIGRMAYALAPKQSDVPAAIKVATVAYDKTAPDSKVKGKARRNNAEQSAYDAGKVSWGRRLKATGIASPHGNAGNASAKGKAQQTGTAKAKTQKTVAPKEVLADMPSTIYASQEAFIEYVLAMVTSLDATVKKAQQRKVANLEVLAFRDSVKDLAKKLA